MIARFHVQSTCAWAYGSRRRGFARAGNYLQAMCDDQPPGSARPLPAAALAAAERRPHLRQHLAEPVGSAPGGLRRDLMLQVLVRGVAAWWRGIDAGALVRRFGVRAPRAPAL